MALLWSNRITVVVPGPAISNKASQAISWYGICFVDPETDMEPFEIVGATAALAELLTLSLKVSATARNLINSFRNSPVELARLERKLGLMKVHLDQIQKLTNESSCEIQELLPQTHMLHILASLRYQQSLLDQVADLHSKLSPRTSRIV